MPHLTVNLKKLEHTTKPEITTSFNCIVQTVRNGLVKVSYKKL